MAIGTLMDNGKLIMENGQREIKNIPLSRGIDLAFGRG
jgi:hypothetical protein